MTNLTHLDAKTLQSFMDHDLSDFITALKNIRLDQPFGARALKSLLEGIGTPDTLQENTILGIGLMAADGASVKGSALIKAVTNGAQSIDTVLERQGKVFNEIHNDLIETISTLLKTQGTSLDSLEDSKFLDVFSDVNRDLGPGTGAGTGTGTKPA
ncbi:type VII secretion system-associated protein (plasmid) [Streptomyces sp. AHU1]|uniref:type VII secretion system-associated protein n=1 Tax=Streptomyces sp. AHU1 TaxID=3377215 RepID=UPI003877C68A